jgi:hypothetical protein
MQDYLINSVFAYTSGNAFLDHGHPRSLSLAMLVYTVTAIVQKRTTKKHKFANQGQKGPQNMGAELITRTGIYLNGTHECPRGRK